MTGEREFFHARSRARRLAMQALYQWQVTEDDMAEVTRQFAATKDYTRVDREHFHALLEAAVKRLFDERIEACMEMPLSQVDPIECAIIRNAAYEIARCDDIDNAVAITEAVRLAKKFANENSYRFINSVLDCFAERCKGRGEAYLIEKYFKRPHGGGVALGIGDDAAVLDAVEERLVVAADTVVEGSHFQPGDDVADIGYKALAAALSDLAAMGATPRWALLALTVPQSDEEWMAQFAGGFFSLADEYKVDLIGGDMTRGPLAATVQVIGLAGPDYMTRSGALPGQGIYVTGNVGSTALAVLHPQALSRCDMRSLNQCTTRRVRPWPRIEHGQVAARYARTAIDISDGVLLDCSRILTASGVGATIELRDLPTVDAFDECCPTLDDVLAALLYGEDYELLFVMDDAHYPDVKEALAAGYAAVTRIGAIEEKPGLRCTFDGADVELPASLGHDHFA